ncbi:iron complex outermembrane receptor protein [Pontibacter ummariensis]|uniref:Iron complex outermembrane recepter protein n=1 Tax=Pontibacter ummariensis TaxID=1610492 RepID=A0A239FGH5_9BACT|nr:TonB-dependent receptor [Pontibacter ummariensis]PRY12292.1 iron complex outermembrane receptor protein [Pontibacter ummariensis]SNS55272.1 iron complex outermembrane recepter protein [Pontibacter ummariensis]
MKKSITLLSLCLLLTQLAWAQHRGASVQGQVIQDNGEALNAASVVIVGTPYGTITNENGYFDMYRLPEGKYQVRAFSMGFEGKTVEVQLERGETEEILFRLSNKANTMAEIEVFGERNKQPEKLDALTRLPLKPSEQIQSISVISEKLIEQQGALTVIEGVRNVPGVYTYSTFGGVRESISSRGFRGIPTLKNGVRVMTDFRGGGFSTDMQGVESVQVLKGASSVTMGAATDLGGPGGIVNIVTKTPKFENAGSLSLRAGSWGLIRPTFDVQRVVNESKTLAVRMNGAYENGGKFRDHMSNESFYINPSIEWRPNARSTLTLEMDYFDEEQSIDVGTVNLSIGNKKNEIYDLPSNRFLGFDSDLTDIRHSTYAARFKHNLTNNLYIRAAAFHSNYNADAIKSNLSAVKRDVENGINVDQVNWYNRSIAHNSSREDKSTVLQFDFVGQKVKTGSVLHTFQAGVDYRAIDLYVPTYNSIAIDRINVLDPATVSNTLPEGLPAFELTRETQSYDYRFGASFQDVIQLTNWARVYGGLRYSTNKTKNDEETSETTHFWNPLAGVMFTVNENINVFGSYTNSSNPRSAAVVDVNGDPLGAERIDQVEAGLKTEWFNNRLRFNLTLFQINNRDMNLEVFRVDETGAVVSAGYYTKGGNDERKGVEVELTGRVLPNLEIVTGYAYIDAQYKEHTTFVPGSAPNNTPKHTFNAWANYTVSEGIARGLSLGLGAYYLGERPYNDWTQDGVQYHAIAPDTAPWYNKAYTILNAQLGYEFQKHWGLRLLLNNILDEVGYDAYRSNYIDRIQPRNFSGIVTYKF